MKTCLLVLAFLASAPLFAQEGYIQGYVVTNENDTIVGLVKNKNSVPYRILQEIKFKKEKNSEVQTFAPTELKGFQIGVDQYISKKLRLHSAVPILIVDGLKKYRDDNSNTTAFVKVLAEGDMSYYELRITGLGTGNEVIYEMLHRKGEDSLFSVYGLNFQERLLAYLSNEPALVEKVKAGVYKRNNLEELVQEYNLMHYRPQQTKTGKTAAVNFYTKPNKKLDLYLVVNDTVEYRLQDKLLFTVMIPDDVKSKVCFGTKDNKSCTLISKLAYYTFSEYYELKVAGNKSKFKIERRSQEEGQQFVSQNLRPK